jgi:cytochrome c556
MPLSRRLALTLVFGLMGLPAGVSAQEADLTPAQEYRQLIMDGLDAHNRAIRTLLGGDLDQSRHLLDHAMAIQSLAGMLPDVFPEGSGPGTRSMAEIWQDWAGFMEKVTALQSASATLVEAARGGDQAAVGEAARAVGGTCRDCHRPFRARRN